MARGLVLSAPRTRPTQGGFTLIELLVTLLVTVVGLAGLFGVFTVTARGNAEARQAAEALSLVGAAADELKSLTVTEIEVNPAYQVIDMGNPTWGPVDFHDGPTAGATGVIFERRVWARRIDDDLVWLKIAVRWAVEGAAIGAAGGMYDRELALEMLRSRTEAPP